MKNLLLLAAAILLIAGCTTSDDYYRGGAYDLETPTRMNPDTGWGSAPDINAPSTRPGTGFQSGGVGNSP